MYKHEMKKGERSAEPRRASWRRPSGASHLVLYRLFHHVDLISVALFSSSVRTVAFTPPYLSLLLQHQTLARIPTACNTITPLDPARVHGTRVLIRVQARGAGVRPAHAVARGLDDVWGDDDGFAVVRRRIMHGVRRGESGGGK